MKSQMELALTIGTVIVGAVLLITALVLSWEMLLPASDSCRIAAGIGYDVMSLQSSLFTIPGTIAVYYTPPSICEFKSQMGLSGSGLICQPLQGGNPNITGISINYLKLSKKYPRYGFSYSEPEYLRTIITFNWIDNNDKNKVKTTDISLKGIATYSPGLQGKDDYLQRSNVVIPKIQTPYGDVISPITDSSVDAIEKIATSMIASAHNNEKYDSEEITLPATWFLTYNSTSKEICEYRIVLNSYIYYYINYFSDDKIKPFRNKFGFQYGYLCDSDSITVEDSILYSPNSPTFCLYKGKDENSKLYDPWNQSNVEKYGTGFLKVRCFNLSKITEDSKINSISVSFDNSQKIGDLNSTYRDASYEMSYKYNATYKNNKVNLELWWLKE